MEKRSIGRPTKYKPEYCEEMLKFFNKDLFEVIGGEVKPAGLPTFEKYAVSINVHMDTLSEWKTKHKDFSVAYKKCKHLQKAHLIYHGLTGNYNAAFAKFVAINCTDMVEKVEQEIKTDHVIHIDQYDADA